MYHHHLSFHPVINTVAQLKRDISRRDYIPVFKIGLTCVGQPILCFNSSESNSFQGLLLLTKNLQRNDA